jgi:hypothetical protein
MTEIVVFAGTKQCGKSTAGKFLSGFALTQMGRRNPGMGFPTKFDITDTGDLVVNASFLDEAGNEVINDAVLDLERRDYEFVKWAEKMVWPYVRIYNYADLLKDIMATVFGVEWKQLYGTNEEKDTPTKVKWMDAVGFLERKEKKVLAGEGKLKEYMTSRELMQFFGTDVCRILLDDCWVESCFRRIEAESPAIAIICDCRFKNEVQFAKDKGAHVIRLLRKPFEGTHRSEKEIEWIKPEEFTAVIDNSNMTMREKNQEILDTMYKLGVFQGFVE